MKITAATIYLVRIDGQDALRIVPNTSLGISRRRESPGVDVANNCSAQ